MEDRSRDDATRMTRALQLRRDMRNNLARAARGPMARYYDDPLAFANECIEWPRGHSLTEYQAEVLRELTRKTRVSVRSLHGAGKSSVLAIAILWFILTRDSAGVDWKCPTTAGSNRQLKRYLWPEVHKWARRLRWETIGRTPFAPNSELMKMEITLRHGSAFAVVSDDPAHIEGVHADAVFYVFDEAKSIGDDVFDAAEGAFSGIGEAMGLNASTPGQPEGRFYEIQSRKAGYEDWYPIHVSLDRAIAAGRVDPEWVERRKAQWGEQSPLYCNRVLGEFRANDEAGVIPLAWIEAAVERWFEHQDQELGPLTTVGVDVARSGNDRTIMALRHRHRISQLRATFHESTMATTGRVSGILNAHTGAMAIVDSDGIGVGVFDRLRELGHKVTPFHAGANSSKRDRSDELGFLNTRAAAWWSFREALDPEYGSTIELPDDDMLLGDLSAPRWKTVSEGLVQIESKDDIKKRIRRSTDRGDAVVMAFWQKPKYRRARMGNTRLRDVSSTAADAVIGPEVNVPGMIGRRPGWR